MNIQHALENFLSSPMHVQVDPSPVRGPAPMCACTYQEADADQMTSTLEAHMSRENFLAAMSSAHNLLAPPSTRSRKPVVQYTTFTTEVREVFEALRLSGNLEKFIEPLLTQPVDATSKLKFTTATYQGLESLVPEVSRITKLKPSAASNLLDHLNLIPKKVRESALANVKERPEGNALEWKTILWGAYLKLAFHIVDIARSNRKDWDFTPPAPEDNEN